MKISAFIPVYNEEARISYALTSLKWCDEIVLLDKTSTDNTVCIARDFGARVITIENTASYDANEFRYLQECTGDWIIIFTASDIMEPKLADSILSAAKEAEQNVGKIMVPFKNIVLGVDDKRSPWSQEYRVGLFRKSVIKLDEHNVHSALDFMPTDVITLPPSCGYIKHLTHATLDIMLDRHIRYWRAEGQNYREKSLKPAFRSVFSSFYRLIKKGSFFIAHDGFAISLAYLTYSMFSYLYKWEHFNKNKVTKTYERLRSENMDEWNKYYGK